MTSRVFHDLDAEVQLAEDLGYDGRRIFDGRSDRIERLRRTRAAILAGNRVQEFIPRSVRTNPETFAQAFARVYREPLIPPEPPEPEEEFA